ncbi:hypothetical protein [Streptomyces sp. NPDC050856]|uniref:hypothetical protein n=1 Tax=Streptomyces sp. NPDC050856 TaxID=3154939 RepID=UPI0033F6EF97
MSDDLPAGPAPEPAPRPHGPDELRALRAPRRLSVDDHMFTAPGLPGTFRLQLFTTPGARPVAVATQIDLAEGMSLSQARCGSSTAPPRTSHRCGWNGSCGRRTQ